MAIQASRGNWDLSQWLYVALMLILILALGCSQGNSGASGEPGKPNVQVEIGKGTAETPLTNARTVALDPRLHQSFLDATIQEPPGNQQRPPDVTLAGKATGKLYKAIVGDSGQGGMWDQVHFVSPSGKRLKYTAVLKTDVGSMTMELYPEHAPNHVRNFVALARAGYYDGLQFDRTVLEEVPIEPGQYLRYIEAGCPKGTGEPDYGSIGYWLKPEISPELKHEAGTVGASFSLEVETAACKFYITLEKAPWIDGNYTIFGKITQGLDVARTIFERPKSPGLEDRPANPVTIRQVIIQTSEGETVASKTG